MKEGIVIGSQVRRTGEILQISIADVAAYLGIDQSEIVAWGIDRAKPDVVQLGQAVMKSRLHQAGN